MNKYERVYICTDDDTVEITTDEEHWCKYCNIKVEETGWFESNESN